MRKITVFLLAVALSLGINAQINEGFDDISTLAGNGWSQINTSVPIGLTNWFQGNDVVFPAFDGATTAYIGTNFNNVTGANTISNWLITPVVMLSDGDSIIFYTRTVTNPAFPDNLQLRLSTDGAASTAPNAPGDVGSYTTLLLEVNPLLVAANYPNAWTKYYAVVSGVGSLNDSRVALRYYVTDGGPSGNNSDYIGVDRFRIKSANNPCPTVNVTLNAKGLQPLWANQGANDANTFYYGLVDAKRIDAAVTGGVGPFTYAWSNTGTNFLLPRAYYPASAIDLFRPTAATTVSVTVTDQGTNCQYTASIAIGWSDAYYCYVQNNIWYIKVCQNGVSNCVPWTAGRTMLQQNTATLGDCLVPKQAKPKDLAIFGKKDVFTHTPAATKLSFEVNPNPSNGEFSILMMDAAGAVSIEVIDVNGNKLYASTLTPQGGQISEIIRLEGLAAGVYFVQINDGKSIATEKVVVRH